MGVTRRLASFSADIRIDRLTTDIPARARLLVLDLLGSIVRAAIEAPSAPSVHAMVGAMGWKGGPCHVFGDPAGYTPSGAAFLNATLGHALDFDDTHAAGTLHPGAPVISTAIAAGEMSGASGADVLAGIIAGYEVACRVATALPAGDHYARGFHPTATCGVFGAAAAAGRVLGLPAAGIESALGIALSQSSGSLQFLADGAWTKPFQVGWAACSGLVAATLAREGFKGPGEALEGRHGFLQAYAPAPKPEQVAQGLGDVWELMKTGVKPYPSCRYGHAGIDAILMLRTELALDPDEVESITYGLSRAGLLLVGEPIEAKRAPSNIVEAQFSAPFVLATALATGKMAWSSYSDLNSARIRSILPRVNCVHDPEIEVEFPTNMSGKITLRARGKVFVRKVILPLGEPSNFLSTDSLTAKFLDLAMPVIGTRARALADQAVKLDQLPRVADLARY